MKASAGKERREWHKITYFGINIYSGNKLLLKCKLYKKALTFALGWVYNILVR